MTKYYAKVADGSLHFHDRKSFDEQVSKYKEDTEVTLELKRMVKPRSINQNSYYYGVVVDRVAIATGFNNEEAHEAIKWKFLKIEKNGIETVRSTKDLTTVEFENLMSEIRSWASMFLSTYIELPNESKFDYTIYKK